MPNPRQPPRARQTRSAQAPEPTSVTAAIRVLPPDPGLAVPLAYANFAQIGISPHDFRLTFGEYSMPTLEAPAPSGQPIETRVRPAVQVVLPLTVVKGFIEALERSIKAWETNFDRPFPDEPASQRA